MIQLTVIQCTYEEELLQGVHLKIILTLFKI